MKNGNGKEKAVFFTLSVLIIGAICYSSLKLYADGALSWHIRQKEYRLMASEILLVFGAMTLNFRFIKRPANIFAALAAASCFLWAHRVLVPVAVSGCYVAYVCCLGGWFRYRLAGRWVWDLSRNFLTGSLLVVCGFCLMSALGVGSIPNLWGFVLITAVLAAFDRKCWRQLRPKEKKETAAAVSFREAMMAAAVFAAFAIQAGRMNIALDFDSLWYGVRSPYILDNGKGIYENLGTIGVVYTYSKGFEVLTLPLSILPSYSFGISFNLWMAAGILAMCFEIGRICTDKRTAGLMTVFLASVPGIMNMSITAKSDIGTLLFQLIMFHEILLYLGKEDEALWYAVASFLFTWTLKPTALVFSTAIMGMSGVYLLATKRFVVRGQKSTKKRREMWIAALSFGALAGIWARTWLITGLPVTSVFSSLLTKLGFQMKYPFDVQKIPNSGSGVSTGQWLKNTIKRVYGILLDPQGEDMGHVILAWGSLTVWFLLCTWALWFFLEKRPGDERERRRDSYLHTVFFPFLICNVVSLVMLTQVDGNYFMLFYVLLAVYVFRLVFRIKKESLRKGIYSLAACVTVFSLVVMSLTNWSWTTGFTPISWRHRGYENHQEDSRREMGELGNQQIWEILAENPRNRLIAIGEHPKVLSFPCSAQSYLDITGSWGNVVLVKYMDYFVEFMRYAKTDYVYAQAGYISGEERAWSLTCNLIEYGILIPVCYEQGNMLAKVDTEGQRTKQSVEYLKEFQEQYRIKAVSQAN